MTTDGELLQGDIMRSKAVLKSAGVTFCNFGSPRSSQAIIVAVFCKAYTVAVRREINRIVEVNGPQLHSPDCGTLPKQGRQPTRNERRPFVRSKKKKKGQLASNDLACSRGVKRSAELNSF